MNRNAAFSHRAFAMVLTAVLASCTGRHGSGLIPDRSLYTSGFVSAAGITSGPFTEYYLPRGTISGFGPNLTRGPYGTLWTADTGSPSVYRLQTSNGILTRVPLPNQLQPFDYMSIVSENLAVWVVTYFPSSSGTNGDYLVGVTPNLRFKIFSLHLTNMQMLTGLAIGPSGKLWFAYAQPCGVGCNPSYGFVTNVSTTGALGTKLRLPEYFLPQSLTEGPDGNIYAAANWQSYGAVPPSNAVIYVISPAGSLIRTIPLANNSNPYSIVTGPDHNIWIAEFGTNKIARLTTAGKITEFPVPTAKADPFAIAVGNGSTLWFNEEQSNKIASITTAGKITEYQVPNSGAIGPVVTGFAQCPTGCGANGVWFLDEADWNHNSIGKLFL